MKHQRKLKCLLIAVLLIGVIFILGSLVLSYNIPPKKIYSVESDNLIRDSSFENFNKTAGDCCNYLSGNASISALKIQDSFEGSFSLELISSNHCACISTPVTNFDNSANYLLSFYYKGDNPRFCNWVSGDNRCIPNRKLEPTRIWAKQIEVLTFTQESTSPSIFLYADSDGTKTVTNLYDDLQVHKLIPIENPNEYKYAEDEEYVIKTKADNKVKGGLISDVNAKTGEAYFITKGKPNVTIKFPWSEVVIIVIMFVIIVRLMFKKE